LFLPLLALLPLVLLNWQAVLNQVAGRDSNAKVHSVHLNHGGLNNDKCKTYPGENNLKLLAHGPLMHNSWTGV
jgi:hypothetical protein